MRSNRNLPELCKQFDLNDLKLTKVPCRPSLDEEIQLKVPLFLVEAFRFIKQNKGFGSEGIFRKQGNTSRVDAAEIAFSGDAPIPEDCTVFDVAVLIKRFFGRIRDGIFCDKGKEAQIGNGGTDVKTGERIKHNPAFWVFTKSIPALNRETLTYLMMNLKDISKSQRHNLKQNWMDIPNLAKIFVPQLFINTSFEVKPGDRAEDIIFAVKRFSGAVETMIEKWPEFTIPLMTTRQVQGQPHSMASGSQVLRSESSRSSNPRSNSYRDVPVDPFNDNSSSARLVSTSSHSHSENVKYSSERESRSTSKSTNKRRGSSVARQLIGWVDKTIDNAKVVIGGRRSSNFNPVEVPKPGFFTTRKNASSGNVSSKKTYIGRSSSYRERTDPSKPTISNPINPISITKNDLCPLKSSNVPSNLPDVYLPLSPVKSSPSPLNSPPKENIDPSPLEQQPLVEAREMKKEEKIANFNQKHQRIQRTGKDKDRRQTSDIAFALRRNQPNAKSSGLGTKTTRRNKSFAAKDVKVPDELFHDLDYVPLVTRMNSRKFKTKSRSRSSVAPEDHLKDTITDAFIKEGIESPFIRHAVSATLEHETFEERIPVIPQNPSKVKYDEVFRRDRVKDLISKYEVDRK